MLSWGRLNIEDTDHDTQPAGSLELVHEQPVFGTIKDIQSLAFRFEEEEEKGHSGKGKGKEGEERAISDVPRLGYLPKDASPTVLVVTSDSGLLSFVTFHSQGERGYFHILKEVEIAEPGLDYAQVGAKLAIDPSSQLIAVSALQNHIKLVVLRSTPRSRFDPVEKISKIDVNGTIIDMEFLTPDPADKDENAMLAVLFHNKETSAYHLATFCIDLKTILTGPLSVKVGTSQLGTNPLGSVLHIKALPNFPYSLVYIDREPEGDDITPGSGSYPLISACATPPPSPYPTHSQALYMGSDTGELYRVNINYAPYSMNFEMISGERPVGKVMHVVARRQIAALPQEHDDDQDMDHPEEIILNTDFLIYSGEQGDGGVLAIKEEETQIDLFAIAHLQNCAPTLDFCMREPSMPGRDTLYVCTGMKTQGAIRKIRSGISVESSGSSGNQFFAGATGLWGIKAQATEEVDTFLVVSFIQSTKVMQSGEAAGRLNDGMLFQVHRAGIVVASPSTAQAGRESATIPHSICVLQNPEHHRKVLVGLRDGNIISYDWTLTSDAISGSIRSARKMANPRLFKLGVMPVKFIHSCQESISRALVVSDRLWQASYVRDFEVHPVLFDSEVSQACSFQTSEIESSQGSFVFIVDHHDMQLASLDKMEKYNCQSLPLGQSPRRILDISSKRLLFVACVGDGFPFAESTLKLVDPSRASNDSPDHVVAEFRLKSGEAVYSLAEWKIPRPGKSDAVYICVGTGQFSPTGSELSAAAPRTGRLVVLSIKQSKKQDRKNRKFELDLRWAMTMSAPVFAISPFMDMKLLISNGPMLKLLVLDLEKKTLVERAAYRERWPIFQISTQGSMICTGSRRESISFYEHRVIQNSDTHVEKIVFLKSAPSARMVSDCLAVSPEFAVGADLSGGVFGVGYSKDDSNCQHSLVDRFSFHVGEVAHKIRLARTWPAEERSFAGIALSQQADENGGGFNMSQGTHATTATALVSSPSSLLLLSSSSQLSGMSALNLWIVRPWVSSDILAAAPNFKKKSTIEDVGTAAAMEIDHKPSTTIPTHPELSQQQPRPLPSTQALVASTVTGGLIGFWRLDQDIFQILSTLQESLQRLDDCRPVLGNQHSRYRSLSSPAHATVDGDLLVRFLALSHGQQVETVERSVGLVRLVDEWIESRGLCGLGEFSCLWKHDHEQQDKQRRPTHGFLANVSKTKEEDVCRSVHVITFILEFLQMLDWHQ
ncbi:hypothetical protein CPC16_007843 [Podila verticillata]|nr:hypothetical protein CPC16_007843 [Podila verticillata]